MLSAIITATSLGDFTISIFSALSSVTSVPGRNPILDGGIARGAQRHGERRVHRQPPVAHRAQRDIGRHQLGGGGREPRLGRVGLHQHIARLRVGDQIGLRRRRRAGEQEGGRRKPKRATRRGRNFMRCDLARAVAGDVPSAWRSEGKEYCRRAQVGRTRSCVEKPALRERTAGNRRKTGRVGGRRAVVTRRIAGPGRAVTADRATLDAVP